MDNQGAVVHQTKFATSEAKVRDAFESLSGSVHVHLEASELAAWIRGILTRQTRVKRVFVSHPKTNAWIAKDPLKGDQVDAFKLAELLRLNRVHEVYYPDDQQRQMFKQLVQHYDELTEQRVRLKQKIKARLRVQGQIMRGASVYGAKGRQPVLRRVQGASVRQALEQLYGLLDYTLQTQQAARKLLEQEACTYPEISRFCEVPGVGLISACRFSGYVQTPHRFSSKRKLWRYCGLGITNRSSDGKLLGHRRLDRCGQMRLKTMSRQVFTATLRTKQDNMFQRCYRQALANTQNATHARLTTQRKIIAVLRAMWKEGSGYQDDLG